VIKLKRSGASEKTKVTPKHVLRKIAVPVLEYGQPDKGYIAGVEVKDRNTSWECTFSGRAGLSEIDIYPLPHKLAHAQSRNQARTRRKKK
jgi:hypothetical protein